MEEIHHQQIRNLLKLHQKQLGKHLDKLGVKVLIDFHHQVYLVALSLVDYLVELSILCKVKIQEEHIQVTLVVVQLLLAHKQRRYHYGYKQHCICCCRRCCCCRVHQ